MLGNWTLLLGITESRARPKYLHWFLVINFQWNCPESGRVGSLQKMESQYKNIVHIDAGKRTQLVKSLKHNWSLEQNNFEILY